MRYIGLFLVMLSSLAFSREYTRYMQKRVRECEAFLDFIGHLRMELSCYLRPLREAAGGFSSDALTEVGFFEAVNSTGNIYEAFSRTRRRLSLSDEELMPLESLFSSLGHSYLDEELKLINMCEENMRSVTEKIKRESPKSIKLISTLSVTAAIGFFILVI